MQGSSVQSQHSAEWRCLLLAVSGRVSSSSSATLALNRIIATPLYGSPQAHRKTLLFHTQHLQYVQSQQGPAAADLKQAGTLMQCGFQGTKKFYWLLVWIATVSYMPTCNNQMYNFDLTQSPCVTARARFPSLWGVFDFFQLKCSGRRNRIALQSRVRNAAQLFGADRISDSYS